MCHKFSTVSVYDSVILSIMSVSTRGCVTLTPLHLLINTKGSTLGGMSD